MGSAAPMQINLSSQELRILLAWAEEAIDTFPGVGTAFVTQAESDLIAKLQQTLEEAGNDEQSPVSSVQ